MLKLENITAIAEEAVLIAIQTSGNCKHYTFMTGEFTFKMTCYDGKTSITINDSFKLEEEFILPVSEILFNKAK